MNEHRLPNGVPVSEGCEGCIAYVALLFRLGQLSMPSGTEIYDLDDPSSGAASDEDRPPH